MVRSRVLPPGVKMLYFKHKILRNIFRLVKFKPLNIRNKMSKKGHETRFVIKNTKLGKLENHGSIIGKSVKIFQCILYETWE